MVDPGPRPELAWLPVDKLDVDPAYQRPLETKASQKVIAHIAANFSWMRLQAILATPGKPGRWLIIDGQHRIAAAKIVGIAHVPSVVIAKVSQAEQAAAFVGANKDRVPVSAPALFHAQLAAGDEAATAVTRACDLAGIKLLRYSIGVDYAPVGTTPAVAALLYSLNKHGEANMVAAVRAIAIACAAERGGLRGEYFLGASLWLHNGGEAGELDGRIGRLGRAAGLRNAIAGERGGTNSKAALIAAKIARAGAGPHLIPGVDRARLMAGR